MTAFAEPFESLVTRQLRWC